jgi:ABC-type transport system substrate-binding protein
VARRFLTAVVLLVALLGACSRGGDGDGGAVTPTTVARQSTSATSTTVVHPRGGSVRVAVRGDADPGAPTSAGAAVRALVLPQLFVAAPDGTWTPSLVEPGSDRTGAGDRSATFRLRADATWSDGTALVAADLARTADHRFVASVDGSADGRRVTVRFTRPMPNWRRLWSGVDSVAAPRPGVWGGPFVVASRTAGLETVLRRNDRWWGAQSSSAPRRSGAPWLDEVHLVTVADETTARLLLARGELDVVAPLAATNRTPQFRAMPGVHVDVGPVAPVGAGGWWFGMLLNTEQLDRGERRGLVGSFAAARFRDVLLRGEAVAPDGLPSIADGDAGAIKGHDVTLTGTVEDPMTALVERSLQKRARANGGTVELRNAEADRVDRWVAAGDFDAALTWVYGDVSGDVGGDVLPVGLWRPVPVVAWRDGSVEGVRASAYGLSAAWNAWEWFRG